MVIAHNINSIIAGNKLKNATNNTAKAMEKLSSGLRINGASDDAAGLSISEKMRGQIRGLQMASRNIQDGISLVQTAEGGLSSILSPPLQRMRKLAVQASNGTLTDEDREVLQQEFDQMKNSIDSIANNTEFNGIKLLNLEPVKSTTGDNNVNKSVLKNIDWNYVNDNINFTANDVCFNKNDGKYMSTDGHKIVYSNDGMNWEQVDSNQSLSGIGYGKNIYVATGSISTAVGIDDGGIVYSNDGVNWSNDVNTNPYINLNAFGMEQNSIAYDGDKFVAVGKYQIGDYKVLTSNDGVNWDVHDDPDNIGFICYGKGKYVGTGYNGIFTSDDGINWTNQGSLQLYTISYGYSKDSVVYEGDKYFIFGEYNSSVLVSDDGVNWNQVRVANDTSTNYKFSSITYDGNQYFAVGTNGVGGKTVIYNSNDGINWSFQKELHNSGSTGDPKIIWDGKQLVV
ncbi:YCF48-related protein [Clostridium sp. Mt-5]|uniref:Flagellin n=1 Tax=Clostridium moutaii TaxID=3240932 RepID=A0ABV4BT06_9CLOT